jgi:hypothetical protein
MRDPIGCPHLPASATLAIIPDCKELSLGVSLWDGQILASLPSVRGLTAYPYVPAMGKGFVALKPLQINDSSALISASGYLVF